MLHKSHKLPALLLSGAMLLSFNSCGLMEMRDSYVETEEAEATTSQMLAPAERVHQVIERPESETAPVSIENTELKVVLTGNIRMDSGILKDAAARAYDGQSYSFLTMYTGLYGSIHGAELAMMSCSTADHLEDQADLHPPVESLAALSELGADILDTTGCGDVKASLTKQGLTGFCASDGSFALAEAEGVKFAFASVEGDVDNWEREIVEKAADASDIVIVSVIWDENVSYDAMTGIAWDLAAAGADVIAGRGNGLGTAAWLDTGDGTRTLAAYSLGNVLATSGKTSELLGGVLSFTVKDKVIEDVVLDPTFTHYTAEYRDYQVFRAATYSDELAANHANSGVYTSVLSDIVRGVVPEEFLPADYRLNTNN